MKQLFICTLLLASLYSVAPDSRAESRSAVILQYHNVSKTTPKSTSVTPQQLATHLAWLKQQGFHILPLKEILQHLQHRSPLPEDKVVAITFDDAHISVCENAWPLLREQQIPFTLFISTYPIEADFPHTCSWQQLKTMHASGLMTAANHGHEHLHLLEYSPAAAKQDILTAQTLIKQQLGDIEHWLAYPYGEFNQALEKQITTLGYLGFGQQSGAIGFDSDFASLPRFPASGQYAQLSTLSVKLLSLPFPASISLSHDSPIPVDSAANPPQLLLKLRESLPHRVRCFNGRGESIQVESHNNTILVSSAERLEAGRHRYNCTSYSGIKDRYYWISQQWLIQQHPKDGLCH